jgi:hypothetical protein
MTKETTQLWLRHDMVHAMARSNRGYAIAPYVMAISV